MARLSGAERLEEQLTDIEDASANGNGEPLEPASEMPAPGAPDTAAQPLAADSVTEVIGETGVAEPGAEIAGSSEEQSVQNPEVEAPPAVSGEPNAADELPDDLRVLTESLEQPTGEMTAVTTGAAGDTGVEAGAQAGEEATEPAESAESTESAEPTEAAESLDDIAPGTVAASTGEEVAEAALGEVEAPRTTVSWWPFIAYDLVWLAAAAYAVWQLQQLPTSQVAYETTFYSMAMLGGLVLLAAGPVLLLIVWLASWIGRKGARIGLMFISALLKGAAATLLGAVIWIGALLLIDYLRLGRPF